MANHVFDLNKLWNRLVSYVNARLQSLSDLTDDDIREVCAFEEGMDEERVIPKASADLLGCVRVGDGLNVDENGVLSNNSLQKKLLWTNPKSNAAFAPQTIDLDLSEYDEIEVVFAHYYSSNSVNTRTIRVGYSADLIATCGITSTTATMFFTHRTCTVRLTDVTFGVGGFKYANSSSYNQNNEYSIPYRIYGIREVS